MNHVNSANANPCFCTEELTYVAQEECGREDYREPHVTVNHEYSIYLGAMCISRRHLLSYSTYQKGVTSKDQRHVYGSLRRTCSRAKRVVEC